MKDRPILFNGDMVKAVLDGRKTQTRRVIKPQPYSVMRVGGRLPRDQPVVFVSKASGSDKQCCPYGVPGDGLWVKEKYRVASLVTAYEFDIQFDDDSYKRCDKLKGASEGNRPAGQWYPSIFMPRWASRITLEVKAVRVERVQEIRPKDCEGEGVVIGRETFPNRPKLLRAYFADLWNRTYEKRGYGWDTNVWVWVIEFGRLP